MKMLKNQKNVKHLQQKTGNTFWKFAVEIGYFQEELESEILKSR